MISYSSPADSMKALMAMHISKVIHWIAVIFLDSNKKLV